MKQVFLCVAAAAIALPLEAPVFSQAPAARPAAKPPPAVEPLKGDWDQIDERMLFLTAQLASVEASLDAVSKGLKVAGYQQSVRQADADRSRKGSELMDRNMGMPTTIRWESFYGKTADKFFYHPIDRNTYYHTQTVLTQRSPKDDLAAGEGVPSRQGLPVQQRPPQIDYIYRANADARKQAEAEAAKLAGKADALLARRRQLEAEQSALWCKIAFQAVAGRELPSKPLYRFDLKATGAGDAAAPEHLEALRAAMDFLREANRLIDAGDDAVDADPARFFAQLSQATAAARSAMDGRLARQESLVLDVGDAHTMVGKLSAVAKRMSDVARNVSDAYRLALDGDRAGDEQRKNTFRGLLQESLIDYAEAVLAGDECANALARQWKVLPDVTRPAPKAVAFVPTETGGAARAGGKSSEAGPVVAPSEVPAARTPNGGTAGLTGSGRIEEQQGAGTSFSDASTGGVAKTNSDTFYRSLDDMLGALPAPMYPMQGKKWTQVKAEAANKAWSDKVLDQTAVLRVKVKDVGHGFGRNENRSAQWKASHGPYWINTEPVMHDTWTAHIFVYFGEDQKDKLALLNVGDSITVEGRLVRAEVADYGQKGWIVCFDLGLAKIEK